MAGDRTRYARKILLASVASLLAAAVVGIGPGPALAASQRYTFSRVASLGDPAPGGGSFTFDFEPSAINNGGGVAFTADVTTGGEGVFVARGGQVSQVTRTGEPAPGGFTMSGGELGRLGLNDRGDAAVPFTLDPLTFPLGLNAGLFRYSGKSQTLSQVVVPGTSAPGGETFQGVFFNTNLNNRGDIVFPGIVTGGDIDPNSPPGYQGMGTGVFLQRKGGAISSVVTPGDPAPGGGVFDAVINPSINGGGDIAFGAHVAGEECIDIGSPFACGESLYLRTATTGVIQSIAHQGDPAPGGGTFRIAFGGVVNRNDDVAFIGDLTPAPNSGQVQGVFIYSGGTLHSVARPGQPMPGGGHFVTAGDQDASYGLNNYGDVSFAAALDTDVNTDGIPDTGLYVRSGQSHRVRLVARTGTAIPGLGTIAYLGLAPYSSSPLGTGGVINDRGQVLFFATLSDGTGVLLVAAPKL